MLGCFIIYLVCLGVVVVVQKDVYVVVFVLCYVGIVLGVVGQVIWVLVEFVGNLVVVVLFYYVDVVV